LFDGRDDDCNGLTDCEEMEACGPRRGCADNLDC
jgi:hypothetical protein